MIMANRPPRSYKSPIGSYKSPIDPGQKVGHDGRYDDSPARPASLMDESTAEDYLRRIGLSPSLTADEATLRALHRAHLIAVPFENLSIHLGEPISLDEDDLVTKIVRNRRGGFCYELNGMFALLLETLGARVTRLAARVHGEKGLGPPYDHLALAVRLPDGSGPWLADVGFGRHSVGPLMLDSRTEQQDPAGRFLLTDTADGDVDVLKDGEPQYQMELRGRSLPDFVATCWWQQTSPLSHFTDGPVCSRLTEDGDRISISGRTLIRTSGESRTEEQLPGDDALLAAYRDHFGIALDRVPGPGRPPPTSDPIG